jgi:hypothetical protein
MKHRFTCIAALVVLADLIALAGVWHVGPTLSLSMALAVPEVEQILSPLYPDPVREDVGSGELLRPARPRAAVVLTAETRDAGIDRRPVARTLARRDIAVLVPESAAGLDATIAQARTLGVPVRVESIASFRDAASPSTIVTRATYAWRLVHLAHGLIATR